MARALVWKEFRQQWVVWLTLVVVPAAGVAALLSQFAAGRNRDEMLTAVLWFSAWGYGLVCGSLLLAGETEENTQCFLDLLPSTRWRLWFGKVVIGLALITAQILTLVAFDYVLLRERFDQRQTTFEGAGLVYFGFLGYGWGLLYGSKAATVLSAIGRAVVMQLVTGIALYVIAIMALLVLFHETRQGMPAALLVVLAAAANAAALGRSAFVYARPFDRRRQGGAPPMSMSELGLAAWREARGFAIGMTILGLLGAAALTFLGVTWWPVETLLIGVFCGLTAAQASRPDAFPRPAREREVSQLRRWLATAGVRFSIGVGAAFLSTLVQLVPALIRIQTATPDQLQIFRTQIVFSIASVLPVYPLTYLTLWLVYGFAVGSLVGRLVRRPLTGALVAVPCAFVYGALMTPAMFVGGALYLWHWWAVPVVLLFGTGVLMLPWASNPANSRWRNRVTLATVLLTCASLANALTARATEIPVNPRIVDAETYRASLPTPEQNAGARLADAALRGLRARLPDLPNEVRAVADNGWEFDDQPLEEFLDRVFADSWANDLAESAKLPTGILLDPRESTLESDSGNIRSGDDAAVLLVARGLQRQRHGEPAAFVDNLETGLALARNMRHNTESQAATFGVYVETQMLRGLELWLEKLEGRPDLLRRAAEVVQKHLSDPPTRVNEVRQAEFLRAVKTFADLSSVRRPGGGADPFSSLAPRDTNVLQFCLQTPWENTHLRRILAWFDFPDALVKIAEEAGPPLVRNTVLDSDHLGGRVRDVYFGPRRSCHPRAAALQVALRIYQAEFGRPAEKLADLVPKYLNEVPEDPFDHHPFRYRISQGEVMEWQELLWRHDPSPDNQSLGWSSSRGVRAGQGILWCVGEDGADDGGSQQQGRTAEWYGTRSPEDVIFLVPLPPAQH
jgi:hypothetical protein